MCGTLQNNFTYTVSLASLSVSCGPGTRGGRLVRGSHSKTQTQNFRSPRSSREGVGGPHWNCVPRSLMSSQRPMQSALSTRKGIIYLWERIRKRWRNQKKSCREVTFEICWNSQVYTSQVPGWKGALRSGAQLQNSACS